MKLYRCNLCGQLVTKIKDTSIPLVCCGQEMEEVKPLSDDSMGQEKHVPLITKKGNTLTVMVGSVPHPMTNEHYIEWVVVETNKRCYRHSFKPGDVPFAKFILEPDERVEGVYEYCNIHGFWKR